MSRRKNAMTRVAAALCLVAAPLSAAQAAETAAAPGGRVPSFYLQCDGNPNNMAAGESVARFLGAITLLSVLAPSPEVPDPSKRRFGADGVAACSQILDGDMAEGNALRRLPLILARALHRIEAKSFADALGDIGKARTEAAAAGLTGNPYFERSLGMSFDLIEAAAYARLGDLDKAMAANFRPTEKLSYSYYPLLAPRGYNALTPHVTQVQVDALTKFGHIVPRYYWILAIALADDGRFAESARAGTVLTDWTATTHFDEDMSFAHGMIAVDHALAGDWDAADRAIKAARAEYDERKRSGKTLAGEAGTIEMFDFYDIIVAAREGRLTDARRSFAARSRWTAPCLGQVSEMNRRLRAGAKADELFGSLAITPEDMWKRRRDEAMAALLESDKDNKALFNLILPYASVQDYERMTSKVWNTNGGTFLAKKAKPVEKLDALPMSGFVAGPMTQPDVLLLHGALQAKARGKTGLVFIMNTQSPDFAFVRFGNRGEPGMAEGQYLEADAVIAELSQVIPSPQDLAMRQADRAKEKK